MCRNKTKKLRKKEARIRKITCKQIKSYLHEGKDIREVAHTEMKE